MILKRISVKIAHINNTIKRPRLAQNKMLQNRWLFNNYIRCANVEIGIRVISEARKREPSTGISQSCISGGSLYQQHCYLFKNSTKRWFLEPIFWRISNDENGKIENAWNKHVASHKIETERCEVIKRGTAKAQLSYLYKWKNSHSVLTASHQLLWNICVYKWMIYVIRSMDTKKKRQIIQKDVTIA